MAVKPSDFFVGVIDFFAVILPGAIIVAIGYPHIPTFLLGEHGIVRPIEGDAVQWIVFAVSAYLAGHFLFLIGSVLDSTLYDPMRLVSVPLDGDKAFRAAEAVRDEMLDGVDAGVNPFQWARAVLRLHAPAALVEIERFEADSKFFRSLCVALFALLLVFLRAPASAAACGGAGGSLCSGAAAFSLALAIPVALMIAEGVRRARSRGARKTRTYAIWLCGAFALACVLLAAAILVARNWQSLVLLALSLLSLSRYAERRWKSTKTAYQYLVVSRSSAPRRGSAPSRGSKRVAQAGAIAVERGVVPRLLLVRALGGQRAWIFPKGHIERGETAVRAAVRELREEAGVTGRPIARAGSSSFASNGEQVTVEYYLMEAVHRGAPHEAREQRWCTIAEAVALLPFPDARRHVRRVGRLIEAGLLTTSMR